MFHTEGGPGLPFFVQMLHADGACRAILEGLLKCDRWGIVPSGARDVSCPNPLPGQLRSSQLGHDGAIEEGDDERDDGDTEGSSFISPAWTVLLTAGTKRRCLL